MENQKNNLKDIRIGVIIPDRNDRPRLLKNCLKMLNSQTLQPEIIRVENDQPTSSGCDITKRYRTGYEFLRNKGLDIIFLIENDDWYAADYIETMVKEWINNGKPEIFGTNYTIYYHIKLFGYFTMNHHERSSAMSTILKPDLNFPWCVDHEPYTDLHLWKVLKGITFKPAKHICLGIKHGEGLCGGRSHIDRLHRYSENGTMDLSKGFLKYVLDNESFNFFANYFNEANQ